MGTIKTGKNGTKQGLGGGSPRFRASNRQPDGTYPVPPRKGPDLTPMNVREFDGKDVSERREMAATEAIEKLVWGMRYAPSIKAKLRYAQQLATLGVPKPPSQYEVSGKNGGGINVIIEQAD
jgi:hypothetical protein